MVARWLGRQDYREGRRENYPKDKQGVTNQRRGRVARQVNTVAVPPPHNEEWRREGGF